MRDRNNPAPNIFLVQNGATFSWEHYFRELVNGKRRTFRDKALFVFLSQLSLVYSVVLNLRAIAYKAGLLRSFLLPKPVISIGNLTVGGTGKTPVTGLVARYLIDRGKRVVVLSRGYGGSLHCQGEHLVSDGDKIHLGPEEAGDEPFLLASSVKGLMVVIGADRYRAGLLALERLDPDIFILDDGFQHLRLKRDLNILLLDCKNPLHNGRTLPAGLLREPESAVRRADLLIYTRCSGVQPEGIAGKPFCAAEHDLTGVISLADGSVHDFACLRGDKGMAFAGVADPAGFFASLEENGLKVIATLAFPDHTSYGQEELDSIIRLMKASRSDYLITTAKDAVKLAAHRERLEGLYYAGLEIRLRDGTQLHKMLDKLL